MYMNPAEAVIAVILGIALVIFLFFKLCDKVAGSDDYVPRDRRYDQPAAKERGKGGSRRHPLDAYVEQYGEISAKKRKRTARKRK